MNRFTLNPTALGGTLPTAGTELGAVCVKTIQTGLGK